MVTGEQKLGNMKKILSITMLLMLSIFAYAQQDVTRFLGIPIDGSKTEMVRKLKEKGFRNDPSTDALVGEFNGTKVNVFVATNNNKVCRIMVADANHVDERAIQIRFNRLCEQFANNSKYVSLQDYTIPEDEDIAYEITVHKKRYEAVFYQQPAVTDTVAIKEKIQSIILSKYTEEQLANPTEEIQSEIIKLSMEYVMEEYSKRPVWFMISDYYGKYYITMFYDNEYNRANGEDL